MADNGGYVSAPIETDPETLAEMSVAEFMDRIPGWRYDPAAPESVLIDVFAAMVAEARDVASDVPTSIFRYFGAKLAGLPPQEAEPARATSTWVAEDDAGYTIEEGMAVGLRAAGDELEVFLVSADVTIPPGATTTSAGAVELIAQIPGIEANDFAAGTEAEVIDATTVQWTATTASTSAGGTDAETDEDYLDRLQAELALQSPRPILARDFAVLAKRVDEIDRALARDLYKPGLNDKQTVSHDGTGGTFTLTFSGQTTAAIQWNANAAAVQAALVALSNIGYDDVIVTGGPLPAAVVIEFTGALAEANQPNLTGSAASLTPGGRTLTITPTQEGAAPDDDRERAVTIGIVDEDGERVSDASAAEADALLQGMREVNFEVWIQHPTYTTIDCTFTATAYPDFDAAEVEAAAEARIAEYLSPRDWAIPPYGEQRVWILENKVRVSEVIEALNRIDGLWHTDSVQIAKHGATLGTADIDLGGSAPLPRAGDVVGTVAPAP